ncbi:MAG: prenyltransferase [Spirochaetia bacterium]|nr:prenyltransferase [Spirochaetia bacterium]
MGLLKNWKTALEVGNFPPGTKIDWLSKWMVLTRAQVFSMTVISSLVGALIALADGKHNIIDTFIVVVTLCLAHASNNLINDYFDYKSGLDTADYPRTQYSPHPIVSGMISEKKLLFVFFLFGAIELSVAVYLFLKTGWPVMAFAVAGFLLSVFYVAPPVKLKYRGLGELAIFLIWGPLITVGTYYVITGEMPLKVWLASIPYGLVVTNVLLGKHLDKFDKDREKGVKTFPVTLGWKNALNFTRINTAMFFISVVLLVAFRVITPFALLCFFAIGRFSTFMNVLSSEKPDEKPKDFPELWPLWYVVWAFWFNRLAGGMFILGLILGTLPFLKF